MMSLRQLEIFLAIASTGSTTRAAQRLFQSQSASSTALAELESRLKVRLFDRVGKRLVLNANGRKLYPKAQLLITQAHEASQLFSTDSGSLRVGASSTIGNYMLPKLLGRSGERSPVNRIVIANSYEIAAQMQNCELDIGLVEGDGQYADLQLTHWCDDELVIVAATGSPWAKLGTDRKALADAPWIMRESGSGTRAVVEQQVLADLDEVNIVLQMSSSEAIYHAVRAGMGVSCLSLHLVQEALDNGQLTVLASQRRVRRHLYIMRHRQRTDTAAVTRFLQRLTP